MTNEQITRLVKELKTALAPIIREMVTEQVQEQTYQYNRDRRDIIHREIRQGVRDVVKQVLADTIDIEVRLKH